MPLLPKGYRQQQQNCNECGQEVRMVHTVASVVVRSPTTEPLYCDWCDFTSHDMRYMGLHVCNFKHGRCKTDPAVDNEEFSEEWIRLHEDGIDYEWRDCQSN